jgi:hypothetical protein
MRLQRTLSGGGLALSAVVVFLAGSVRAQSPQPAAAPPVAAPPAAPPSSSGPPSGAPAAGSAPAPAETGAAPAGAPPTQGGAYTVRLRSLERNVNDLKEQVFRVKARLNLLKETVLGGVIGASRCVIRHKNEMGGQFRLVKVVYALDGVQILSKADDTGRLSDMHEFDVYNGAIQPGTHTLTVQLIYSGYGYGVFSYLKNYKWNVRSSNSFVAADGKATVVLVVGYEKGGMTTNLDEKPAVDFRISTVAPEGMGAPPAK